ncbi:hypothetical protein [Acinetobacter stercoris]|uniref:Uncharacterized protein n=1 Tax=Acinetobacter stercoris TaxID=2126983 RepID=A0A2U3N308_9GAMM|nr:hypothetical protein [Acinetobacter stercoris]SPL72042.1 hypothetical protein KPC_3220 [Acinetobacter stercoris]
MTILQDFSDQEITQGAIGYKSTEYKIKGAQFFKAKLIFKWDFTRKTPVANLVALDFDIKEDNLSNIGIDNKTLLKVKS